MTLALRRRLGQDYVFVVVAVTFLALLISAGLRATPSVLIQPLESAFAWPRSLISLAAAIGIVLYGLVGPFAAAVMQQFGIRRTVLGAMALMAIATGTSAFMTQPWHLVLLWGVLSGIGSGCVASVLGATIVNRWFVTRRGLVMGLMTASTATGNLVFLPILAAIAQRHGWRPVVVTVALATAFLVPVVHWLLPERPIDIGLRRFGALPTTAEESPAVGGNPFSIALRALCGAMRRRDFWYLFTTFFICGFTTNGLVGTHLIALCGDHGIMEVRAAGLLALMGVFDLFGTTASGWLTDRYDPRKLLFAYYSLRGAALVYLPYSNFSLTSLSVFAVFYGLDWIATVPPTLRLTSDVFGDSAAPVIFGWILAGHQLGAGCAAFLAGYLRTVQGDYVDAFVLAGLSGVIAAAIALLIRRSPTQRTLVGLAGQPSSAS
ncbi:MAG TPA: MFS transporter [Steroidobacteraceae bacterium]|nr:MFS transporter [Steroidobacteraceae bacterium]